MLRTLVLTTFACLMTVPASAKQVVVCTNPKHALKIAAELTDVDQGLRSASLKMQVDYRARGFKGPLKRERLRSTNGPGFTSARGASRSGVYEFELVIPNDQLNKSFDDVELSAFFEKPFSDHEVYPHRIPVLCRSRVK